MNMINEMQQNPLLTMQEILDMGLIPATSRPTFATWLRKGYFPQPDKAIGNKKYWLASTVTAWRNAA